MKIEEFQERIDSTEYWDSDILDFSINYFGDEVCMYIYNDDKTSWKLSFLSCFKVRYETDAAWRSIPHVKDMNAPQLGYYGQDITVYENKEDNRFMDIKMDLTIMQVQLSFKDMLLEKVLNEDVSFFWK